MHRLRAAVVPHIHLLPSCGKGVPLPMVVDAPAVGQRGRTCRNMLCSVARPQHCSIRCQVIWGVFLQEVSVAAVLQGAACSSDAQSTSLLAPRQT